MANENIEMLRRVAGALGDLNNEVVCVGGAVLELFADADIAEAARPTEDVDVIVNVVSKVEFYSPRCSLIDIISRNQ